MKTNIKRLIKIGLLWAIFLLPGCFIGHFVTEYYSSLNPDSARKLFSFFVGLAYALLFGKIYLDLVIDRFIKKRHLITEEEFNAIWNKSYEGQQNEQTNRSAK